MPYNTLLADILKTWVTMKRWSEKQELKPQELTVPERYPGYSASLGLVEDMPSHFDPSPLGLEEL